MSVCYSNHSVLNLPPEERLLKEVNLRLIHLDERERHNQLMEQEHYLGNANAIGQVLRYVAEYQGEWVAVLTFCSAALQPPPSAAAPLKSSFLSAPHRLLFRTEHR